MHGLPQANPTVLPNKREILWALAGYTLAACALGYPVFHGGFLVSPHSDQYIGAYAVREFGTAMIRTSRRRRRWERFRIPDSGFQIPERF